MSYSMIVFHGQTTNAGLKC